MIRSVFRNLTPRRSFTTRIVSEEEWNELQEKVTKINESLNDAIKEKEHNYLNASSYPLLKQGEYWFGIFLTWLFIGFYTSYTIGRKFKKECKDLPDQINKCNDETKEMLSVNLKRLEEEIKYLINDKDTSLNWKIDRLENILKQKH